MGKIIMILLLIIQGVIAAASDRMGIQINDTIQKPVINRIEKNLPLKPGLKNLSLPQQIELELNRIMDKYKEQPSTPVIWSKIKMEVNNFLYSLYRNGKLAGAKTAEAYFINIDQQTMTAQDIASGKKVLIVGYTSTVKPAEFEIIRIERMLSGK